MTAIEYKGSMVAKLLGLPPPPPYLWTESALLRFDSDVEGVEVKGVEVEGVEIEGVEVEVDLLKFHVIVAAILLQE